MSDTSPVCPRCGAALEPRVLTVEEAGAILRVGKNTMYGLIADGAVASITIGRRRLITRAAIDDFLDDRH